MSKAQIYMNILDSIKTHKYREAHNIHKMMGANGMVSKSARYSMIQRLINSAILVKQGKVYQVVEHKIKKKLSD